MPELRPKRLKLAEREIERVQQMRDATMQGISDALDELAPSIQRDADRAIKRIVSSGYSKRTVRAELRKLTRGHYAKIRKAVAGQIEDVAGIVTRHSLDRAAWMAANRLGEEDNPEFVSRYKSYFQAAYSSPSVRTALVSAVMRVTRHMAKKPRTPGDKLIKREMLPWSKQGHLSKRLHRSSVEFERKVQSQVSRMIREGTAMQDANELIVGVLKKTGGKTIAQGPFPQYLRDYQEAGNRFLHLSEPPKKASAEWKEWDRERKEWRMARRRLARYSRRLVGGGKVQNAIVEVLQAHTPKSLDRSLSVWIGQKQQYNAERILETETMTAMRQAQVHDDAQTPGVVAYVWRLQRDARRDFAKRTKPRKIKLRSGRRSHRKRRCICEMMDGKKVSPDYLRDYPQGGHPHCMCWFEPVYDRKALLSSPVTAAEDRWYQREFGD